jgi:hypothetical protein
MKRFYILNVQKLDNNDLSGLTLETIIAGNTAQPALG